MKTVFCRNVALSGLRRLQRRHALLKRWAHAPARPGRAFRVGALAAIALQVLVPAGPAPLFAQPAAAIALAGQKAGPGEIVEIPLTVNTDSLIGLAQFVIAFDSAKLTLDAPPVTLGAGAAGFALTAINRNLPFLPYDARATAHFLVQISGGGASALAGDSVEVVKLRFRVRGALQDSTPVLLDPGANRTFLTTIHLTTLSGSRLALRDGWVLIADSEPPAPFALLQPPDSSWVGTPKPAFSWAPSTDSISGLAQYQLVVDDTVRAATIPPSAQRITPPDALPDGRHTWYVRAVDGAGNSRRSDQTWTFSSDATPPRSAITQPAPGAALTQHQIVVRGTASDSSDGFAGSGVARVFVSADSGQTWQEASNTGTTYSSWVFVFAGLLDGRYTLMSRAEDRLGNREAPHAAGQIDIITAAGSPETDPPAAFAVSQNYPNPFRPNASGTAHTVVAIQVPHAARVTVEIFDLRGRRILATTRQVHAPRRFTWRWDGHDQRGNRVPTGIYFCRVRSGGSSVVKRILLAGRAEPY